MIMCVNGQDVFHLPLSAAGGQWPLLAASLPVVMEKDKQDLMDSNEADILLHERMEAKRLPPHVTVSVKPRTWLTGSKKKWQAGRILILKATNPQWHAIPFLLNHTKSTNTQQVA